MKFILFILCFGLFCSVSATAHCDDGKKSVSGLLEDKYKELKGIVFGPFAKIIATAGFIWSAITAYFGGGFKPLILSTGIGMGIGFGEKFIDILFG